MFTHDVGQESGLLRAGMALTIEPAFQILEEQINICSEDLIVVMESRAEVLFAFVPFTIDQIEKQMTVDWLI